MKIIPAGITRSRVNNHLTLVTIRHEPEFVYELSDYYGALGCERAGQATNAGSVVSAQQYRGPIDCSPAGITPQAGIFNGLFGSLF